MHPQFAELTPTWFNRAFVYTGSIGEFRYRFAGDKDNGVLHTAVYSNLCYELAQDKEERDFPWNEEGVEALTCEVLPAEGIGLAIMNRLSRAAAFRIRNADEEADLQAAPIAEADG